MIKRQFTMYLENKPGKLAGVIGKLATAKVNIEGISVSESTDVGLIQMVVDKAPPTEAVLKKLKVPFTQQAVAVLKLPDRPGVLAGGMLKLAKAGVNINYIYATGHDCQCGCTCECTTFAVVSAPDLRAVEAAWGQK